MRLILLGLIYFLGLGSVAFGRVPELADPSRSSGVLQINGKFLFLNGKAVHSVFIFGVYEISLFLEQRSSSAEEILKSPEIKEISLKFLRSVSADQLKKALSDGYAENCDPNCDRFKKAMDLILSKIPNVEEGDFIQFLFMQDRMILKSSRGSYLVIREPEFNKILLSIWLGAHPPSEGVKEGILGKKN